jgi:hypothetical protein
MALSAKPLNIQSVVLVVSAPMMGLKFSVSPTIFAFVRLFYIPLFDGIMEYRVSLDLFRVFFLPSLRGDGPIATMIFGPLFILIAFHDSTIIKPPSCVFAKFLSRERGCTQNGGCMGEKSTRAP